MRQAGEPTHIRAAPTHPNPYPYYQRLAMEQPLYREDRTGDWVATSAASVMAILHSDICFTRPAADPVPQILHGTPVADLFGRLVRLRDDAKHDPLKRCVGATLRDVDPSRVIGLAQASATELARSIGSPHDGERLTRFIYTLPIHVIAHLTGVPRTRIEDVAMWVRDYATAATAASTGVPPATPAVIAAGSTGARELGSLFETLAHDSALDPASLFAGLLRHAGQAGDLDHEDVIANAIGFLAQGLVATGTLIGATLLAIARHPEVRAAVNGDARRLSNVIQEVVRCDPSTQATLRFVSRDAVVAGQHLHAGETIVVSIAAANRDPALNPAPGKFDLWRTNRQSLEFGRGRHACPGDPLAVLIAEVATTHLLKSGVALDKIAAQVSYRPSALVRIPVFA